jgi:hypothetical protein
MNVRSTITSTNGISISHILKFGCSHCWSTGLCLTSCCHGPGGIISMYSVSTRRSYAHEAVLSLCLSFHIRSIRNGVVKCAPYRPRRPPRPAATEESSVSGHLSQCCQQVGSHSFWYMPSFGSMPHICCLSLQRFRLGQLELEGLMPPVFRLGLGVRHLKSRA